jgi:rhodanese-related sulfurtransferase
MYPLLPANPIRSLLNHTPEGDAQMLLPITIICAVLVVAVAVARRVKDSRQLERHSITPQALHALMTSGQQVLVLDVRQPLDLLGESVILPGAQWISPEDVVANPSLLPRECDLVVYCTCPSDKTSRIILRRALALGFQRTKFLKGGLDGWKAQGFPVEPYTKPFGLKPGSTAEGAALVDCVKQK